MWQKHHCVLYAACVYVCASDHLAHNKYLSYIHVLCSTYVELMFFSWSFHGSLAVQSHNLSSGLYIQPPCLQGFIRFHIGILFPNFPIINHSIQIFYKACKLIFYVHLCVLFNQVRGVYQDFKICCQDKTLFKCHVC